MIPNQKRRKSFFAEQRDSTANPNFINTMEFGFLKSNVKRIIRDAAEGNIAPDDYVYFASDNLLNACIQESYEQYTTNRTLRLALYYYRTVALPNKWVTPDTDINGEYSIAGSELIKVTEREAIWSTAYNIFVAIANKTADPVQALMQFTRFQKGSIKSL